MNYQDLEQLSASDFRARAQQSWMAQLDDGLPRYLFRGQNAFHLQQDGTPSINSYFARLPADRVLVGQAYTTFRYGSKICSGTWGYHVGHEDALAVLQHYGWRTPSIDFSGTVDIALTFALEPTPRTPVVFVLDRSLLSDEIAVSEHDFLIAPKEDDGLQSRWWRQDGFGVMNATWREADTTRKFNVFAAAGRAIKTFAVFNDETITKKSYDDLLDLKQDVHAKRAQDTLRIFCEHQFGEDLHPQLRSWIADINSFKS